MPDVTEIRNPLDVARLEHFLANIPQDVSFGRKIPRFSTPIKVQQFTFGQSNPTYFVQDGSGKSFVLRRKPTANSKLVLKLAHAIEREFHILNAISRCNDEVSNKYKVPIPEVYVLCEDESKLGWVFYIMEYVEGRLIKRADMPEIPRADQHKYWATIMQTVSAIHRLDYSLLAKNLPAKHFPNLNLTSLTSLTPQTSSLLYFERQVKTLRRMEVLQSRTVDRIPHFDAITEWILRNSPSDPSPQVLIHGDCKIDNLLFHPTEPKVIAVLDWELCTVGHPLFDLANLLQPYEFPTALNRLVYNAPELTLGCEQTSSSEESKQLLRLYMHKLGTMWDPNDADNNPILKWNVGVVFGLLRLCVISQGIAMRVKKGSASSASAELYGGLYKYLGDLAYSRSCGPSKL